MYKTETIFQVGANPRSPQKTKGFIVNSLFEFTMATIFYLALQS